MYRESARIRRQSLGEQHPDYARSLDNLGAVHLTRGRDEEAERVLQEAAEIRRAACGARSMEYASSLVKLAQLREKRGEYSQAAEMLESVLAIAREAVGEHHPHYTSAVELLHRVRNAQGESGSRETAPRDEAPPTRVVRVFVSSTFRDMHPEREELVKRVFPRIQALCRGRGVVFHAVDLRWGITDEQKARNQVLPLCLAEIDRSRPYFIGVLGERYGWVPTEFPGSMLKAYPWLEQHRGRSATELEIIHGAFSGDRPNPQARFYFRDPRYVHTLPEPERAVHREQPTPEDIRAYGEAEAHQLADERAERLRRLKTRIRQSGMPVHED